MWQALPLLLGTGAGLDTVRLSDGVRALEKHLPYARLGVAVMDPSTRQVWSYRGAERFPMQSVFKLPLAVAILRMADDGKFSLDREVLVTKANLSVPYSQINDEVRSGPRWYSIRRLVEMAVKSSDNTAADLLLNLASGPKRVQAQLNRLGIQGIRIDRLERDLQRDNAGLGPFRPEWTDEGKLAAAVAAVPLARQRSSIQRYLNDPRDTATPLGMLDLLYGLEKKPWLRPASRQWLLQVMAQAATGPHRLRAGLPRGSILAHKTGTGRAIAGRVGALNDVGIATLPNGRHLIVVAMLAGSAGTNAQRESAIAEVGRLAVRSLSRPAAGRPYRKGRG